MNVHTKVMGTRVLVREPDLNDMKLINSFAKKELTTEEVYVASMYLANDQVDRTFERFPVSYLDQFAETIVGKSLLIGHDHRSAPEGLFFKADVIQEGGITHLRPSFYVVKTTANQHLRAQIDGGVYRYVSIGFHYEDLTCDICGRSIFNQECPHVPGRTYDGTTCTATYAGAAEAVEGSIVYLGAQYGAELKKAHEDSDSRRMCALKAETVDQKPETTDNRQQTTDRNPISQKQLSGTAAVAPRSPLDESTDSLLSYDSDEVAALRVSLGVANKLLEHERERARGLEPLARDGQRYRDQLQTEIRRLAACVDRVTEGKILGDALAESDAETLEEVRTDYLKLFDEKYPPRPHSLTAHQETPSKETDPAEYL